MQRRQLWIAVLSVIFLAACSGEKHKPTLFLIGDSTVKSGEGKGENEHWGWGSFIDQYIDTSRLSVENHARGGRSTKTFITDGKWDTVLSRLQAGDYILMQFGHNDQSPLDDTARARGTLKGIEEDSVEIFNPVLQKQEIVYTYGKYLRKYIDEAKAKNATIIVLSPVPRVKWENGVLRSMDDYAVWAEAIAREKEAIFINLNQLVSTAYTALGEDKVQEFFPSDKTHTNADGAKFIAEKLAEYMSEKNEIPLSEYIYKKSGR